MSLKIIFEPTSEEAELLFDMPSPASIHLPAWYRAMPVHLDDEEQTGLAPDGVASSNLTLKGCMPFLDAITSGYMFTLPFDMEIRKNDRGQVGLRWATNIDFIGQHGTDQAPGLPVPMGASPSILKWRTGWRVITPPGYSCLYTHPLNHIDLPFITLSGVVDTDSYGLGVDFPFRLLDTKKNLFILEKGTPICQVIPFKRDNWKSETKPLDLPTQRKNGFTLKSKIVRSYQMQFWNKKSFQ
jgi:hypothetical protein